jgi:hypothetical protein
VASINEAKEVILDLIVEASKTKPDSGVTINVLNTHKAQADAIKALAEAYDSLS